MFETSHSSLLSRKNQYYTAKTKLYSNKEKTEGKLIENQ